MPMKVLNLPVSESSLVAGTVAGVLSLLVRVDTGADDDFSAMLCPGRSSATLWIDYGV